MPQKCSMLTAQLLNPSHALATAPRMLRACSAAHGGVRAQGKV
jgi:hypothetical protein